jgi:hypothetical protein
MKNRRFLPLLLLAACSSSSSSTDDTPAPATKPTAAAPAPAPAPAAQPVGIVVVFETQHLWLGNDSWWDKAATAKTEGLWKEMHDALDRLAKVDLPGAQIALVGYGEQASTVWTGPVAQLVGGRLGTQQGLTSVSVDDGAIAPELGMNVDAGLDRAISELAQMKVGKQHVLLIGDGVDNNDKANLLGEHDALARAGIDVTAIYVQAPIGDLPGDPNAWKSLTSDVKLLDSGDKLADTVVAAATTWR